MAVTQYFQRFERWKILTVFSWYNGMTIFNTFLCIFIKKYLQSLEFQRFNMSNCNKKVPKRGSIFRFKDFIHFKPGFVYIYL